MSAENSRATGTPGSTQEALPPTPHLGQLKRQAKDLQRQLNDGQEGALVQARACQLLPAKDGSWPLSRAQFLLARRYGFSSWTALKRQVETQGQPPTEEEFLRQALWPGYAPKAYAMLEHHPQLGQSSLATACATGNVELVRRELQRDPGLAKQLVPPLNWQPLLYACFSNFLRRAEYREALAQVAALLLDAGADPNARFINPADGVEESALYGASGLANVPELTRLLLQAGASPDDGETLYHTAEFSDHTCLRLVLEAGPKPEDITYCLKRKLDYEDLEGARIFLEYGADPNATYPAGGLHLNALQHAILRGRSPQILALLLEWRADPMARNARGHTSYQMACRLGYEGARQVLAEHGAEHPLDPRDQLLGACARGDRAAAQTLMAQHPGLLQSLDQHDREALGMAVQANKLAAVQLMLELGFDVGATVSNGAGMTPLHWAGWFALPEMTELLLQYQPPLEALNTYGGTPLSCTVYASRHNHENGPRSLAPPAQRPNDYARVVSLLLKAGCRPDSAWLGLGAAPVDAVLRAALSGAD